MTKANEGSQNQLASDCRHNPETPHPHVPGQLCNTGRYQLESKAALAQRLHTIDCVF
jgi:hypothetical protein